jgi:Porin PorA
MRRAIAYVLIGLGTFAVALGVLMPLYLYPSVAMVPLDTKSTTVSTGSDMTLLDRGTGEVRQNVPLVATFRIASDLTAPEVKAGGSTAVWRIGLVVAEKGKPNTPVQVTLERFCVNRTTNMAVRSCTRQYINTDGKVNQPVQPSGLIYKFPFGTQPKDYQYYDADTRSAFPARFAGHEVIDGLPVYRFVQQIPPTKVEDLPEVPGNLVNGQAGTSVPATRYYQDTRTIWVEPATGIVVKQQDAVRQTLHGMDGREGATVMAGTLNFSDSTIRELTDSAKKGRAGLSIIQGNTPIVVLVVGLVAIAAGLVLLLWRREPRAPRRAETGGAHAG